MTSSSHARQMAKIRRSSRNRRAEVGLRSYRPTRSDLGWLFGCTERWIGELRQRGVLPEGISLPEAVERMTHYRMQQRAAEKADV